MTNFLQADEIEVKNLFHESRESLLELAEIMKIDDLSEDFLKEIVIPISLFLHKQFPKREKPYFICFMLVKRKLTNTKLILKFICSEKATKFCKISTIALTVTS